MKLRSFTNGPSGKFAWAFILVACFVALSSAPIKADESSDPPQPVVIRSIKNDLSPVLRDIEPLPPYTTGPAVT
ncbi:MAG: hypothetical protein ACE5JP_14735, partial [Candidatus Bipolaricaulia bacterium]